MFSRIAFDEICESNLDFKLNEIGMEIVETCSGLPPANKAIDRVMFCKPTSLLNGDGLPTIFMKNWPKTVTLLWLHCS